MNQKFPHILRISEKAKRVRLQVSAEEGLVRDRRSKDLGFLAQFPSVSEPKVALEPCMVRFHSRSNRLCA